MVCEHSKRVFSMIYRSLRGLDGRVLDAGGPEEEAAVLRERRLEDVLLGRVAELEEAVAEVRHVDAHREVLDAGRLRTSCLERETNVKLGEGEAIGGEELLDEAEGGRGEEVVLASGEQVAEAVLVGAADDRHQIVV